MMPVSKYRSPIPNDLLKQVYECEFLPLHKGITAETIRSDPTYGEQLRFMLSQHNPSYACIPLINIATQLTNLRKRGVCNAGVGTARPGAKIVERVIEELGLEMIQHDIPLETIESIINGVRRRMDQ